MFSIIKICPQGSGGLHKTTLWVNLRNPAQMQKKGFMKVALNDWMDYYSVRYFFKFYKN